MTFTELRTGLADRGFAYLTAARLGRYINRGRSRLDGAARWPCRESSGEGTAPLEIPDLGHIEAVTNESQDYPLRSRPALVRRTPVRPAPGARECG